MKLPFIKTIKEKIEKKTPSDYDKYLASKYWKETREKILDIKGRHCMFCGGTEKLTVHHQPDGYQYLGDELNHLEHCSIFCQACHRTLHMAKFNLSKFKKK